MSNSRHEFLHRESGLSVASGTTIKADVIDNYNLNYSKRNEWQFSRERINSNPFWWVWWWGGMQSKQSNNQHIPYDRITVRCAANTSTNDVFVLALLRVGDSKRYHSSLFVHCTTNPENTVNIEETVPVCQYRGSWNCRPECYCVKWTVVAIGSVLVLLLLLLFVSYFSAFVCGFCCAPGSFFVKLTFGNIFVECVLDNALKAIVCTNQPSVTASRDSFNKTKTERAKCLAFILLA